jgi:DNA-3-methyladenine glycosylase I
LANDKRCGWARGGSELMLRYHDEEWGVPSHDDRHLFEMLTLEGAQAGLSWNTILNKRENYRRALEGFDFATVAAYGGTDTARLLADAGIVRNRAKIAATIGNARALLAVREDFGSFDAYVWRFAGGSPRRNAFGSLREAPASTAESDAMSRELKGRGFRFVGSTICYAFMQAVGMVNDHEVGASGTRRCELGRGQSSSQAINAPIRSS